MRKPYDEPDLLPRIKEKIMALTDAENEAELQDEFEDINEYLEEQDSQRERKGLLAGWGMSLVLHALMLLILGFVVIVSNIMEDKPPVRAVLLDPPTPPPEDPKDIEFIEPEQVVVHPEETTNEVTVVTDIEIEVVEITTEDVEQEQNEAKGRDDAVSDSEMGGQGVAAFIGAGGGGKGAFGRSIGGDKRRIGQAFGPHGREVTTIMDMGLRWLMKHQSVDGKWDSDDYWLNCTDDGPKMEPGRTAAGDEDMAMTGYAILCFLGAGYDHRTPNKYRRVVQSGIDWLLANQKPDGLLGERNYEHPVATMALAEAYAMTNDHRLREPTQKAVDIILARQVRDGDGYPLGWDYTSPKLERMDSSVTVWNIFALKSAKAGGIDVGEGLEGSKRWLEGAWKASNINWQQLNDPYEDESIFPYTWNGKNGETKKDHLSFAGGCASVFLGYESGDIMLETMANDLENRFINNDKWKNNTYCLYYSSLFLFQMGKERWENMMNRYAPYLINNFVKEDGCRQGTWNFENQNWHGADTSHVLNHTYALLSLEVAIRYERVMK